MTTGDMVEVVCEDGSRSFGTIVSMKDSMFEIKFVDGSVGLEESADCYEFGGVEKHEMPIIEIKEVNQ